MYLYIHNFNILNKPTIKQKGFHWSEKILILESLQEKKKNALFLSLQVLWQGQIITAIRSYNTLIKQ